MYLGSGLPVLRGPPVHGRVVLQPAPRTLGLRLGPDAQRPLDGGLVDNLLAEGEADRHRDAVYPAAADIGLGRHELGGRDCGEGTGDRVALAVRIGWTGDTATASNAGLGTIRKSDANGPGPGETWPPGAAKPVQAVSATMSTAASTNSDEMRVVIPFVLYRIT